MQQHLNIQTSYNQASAKESMRRLNEFAYDLVDNYSTYDRYENEYSITIYDVPDLELKEFALMVLQSEDYFLSESTGCDNKLFTSKVVPALYAMLKNPSSQDNREIFCDEYMKAIIDYCTPQMCKILEQAMIEFNISTNTYIED